MRTKGLLVGVGLTLAASTHLLGQSDATLNVIGPTRFTIDPICNARGGVSFDSVVRNNGSREVELALTADEPASKPAGKPVLATVTVVPFAADGQSAKKTSLKPLEQTSFRLTVTGAFSSSDWEIQIRNSGVPVGSITMGVPAVGLGVKLDTPTPDSPELRFERGRPTAITLRNDDALEYSAKMHYTVRGIAETKDVVLPANGTQQVELTPPAGWFSSLVRTPFKDDVVEGRVLLVFNAPCVSGPPKTTAGTTTPATPVPTRLIRVSTALGNWPTLGTNAMANLFLLIVLALGGIASLILNIFLPAHGRRRRARAQLSLLALQIDDLPSKGDPRIRVSVAVERQQLEDRLRKLKVQDTQFSAQMTEIEHGLVRLGTRLGLLGQMDLVLNRYWRQRCVIVSDEVEELRRQLTDLLKRHDPTDVDILAAQALIAGIDQALKNSNTANPDLANRLAQTISELNKAFDKDDKGTPGAIGISPVWTSINAELGEDCLGVIGSIGSTDPGKILPINYARLARAVFILKQVRNFITLCQATGSTGSLTAHQTELRDKVVSRLRGGSWDELIQAERFVRQVREGIFYEDVEKEVADKKVAIEPTRIIVRQFEHTELRARFLDNRINRSAAREDYACTWDFVDNKVKLVGWYVSGYFPMATEETPEDGQGRIRKSWKRFRGKEEKLHAPYQIALTIARDDGKIIGEGIKDTIRVRSRIPLKVRSSFWSESLRFVLALGIAAAGLLAGAREQILRLDTFTAVITVFLLGFGSDRIKNMLMQRDDNTANAETKTATANG